MKRSPAMYWVGVNMLCVVLLTSGQHVCDSSSSIFRIPGDAVITGFFGAHYGENCSIPDPHGLQLIQSAISAIEAIRANNFVPGVHIGLTIYDTCSQDDMAQKALIAAMVDAECKQEYVLGGIAEEKTLPGIQEVARSLSLPVTRVGHMDQTLLAILAARIVASMRWSPLNYIVSSRSDLSQVFQSEASLYDICIEHSSLLHVNKAKTEGVVVVLADFEEIKRLLPKLAFNKILLVPLDGQYSPLGGLKSKAVVLLPTTVQSKLQDNTTWEEPLTQSKSSVMQLQVLSDTLKLVGALRSKISSHCSGDKEWTICPGLPKIGLRASQTPDIANDPKLLEAAMNVIHIPTDQFEGYIVAEDGVHGIRKVGAMKLQGDQWTFDLEANYTETDESFWKCNGSECKICINRDYLMNKYDDTPTIVILRNEAWVAALLTISAVGIVACITIFIFIIVRICKKDILEGNPSFSFLLLVATVFMYSSIIPFCLEIVKNEFYSGIICGTKVLASSMSYSLVFSILLARSLLLASCDRDGGLMSHVNGYIQSVLCFFIVLVQVALTLQFCAVNWLLLTQEQCYEMTKGKLYLLLHSYNAFLNLMLLFVTPFIVKSKRNYREGMYFAVASWLCFIVFGGWVTLFWIGNDGWSDVAICLGLVSTASVVLISVFIPRTYLMLSGIVRDHIVSTLPSLAHTASTSIVDVNYRSTQALYDSVTTGHRSGLVNPNFYTDHHRATTPSTSRVESRNANNKTPDNTYERYDSPPSPNNITRF